MSNDLRISVSSLVRRGLCLWEGYLLDQYLEVWMRRPRPIYLLGVLWSHDVDDPALQLPIDSKDVDLLDGRREKIFAFREVVR